MLMLWHLKDGIFRRRFNLSNEQSKTRNRSRSRNKESALFAYDTVTNNNNKGKYMSRKNRRNNHSNQHHDNHAEKNHFELRHIQPLTVNQERVWDAYEAGSNLMLHGYAGTGKTFLSSYLALREVLHYETYKKVVIIRSVVPSRDMGFLPGTEKQKRKFMNSLIKKSVMIFLVVVMVGRY